MEDSGKTGKTLALKLLICLFFTVITVFFIVQASFGARNGGDKHLSQSENGATAGGTIFSSIKTLLDKMEGTRTNTLTPSWELAVSGEVFITEENGRLYLTSTRGQVVAVDAASGSILWSLDLGVWVSAAAAADSGVIYIGATNHVLYALDAGSGALLWYFTAQGEILAKPEVSDGMVFFTADNDSVYDLVHRLYALDARSGALLWIYDTESWTPSPPTVGASAVYLGGYRREVYALQKATGWELWSFKASNIILSSPCIASGKVLFACIDGWVHAVDAASGTPEWSRKLPGFTWLAPPDGSGLLYACSHRNNLTALSLETGEDLWTFDDGDFLSCAHLEQTDTVCAFNAQGKAYILDEASGEPLDILLAPHGFASPPLLVGGYIYASSSDGMVCAYALPADVQP
jgi:outer membrane protein assembly factor BamB